MKRYLLFAGECHYPEGGWGDFQGHFDEYHQAMALGEELLAEDYSKRQKSWDWYHVVDTTSLNMIRKACKG